MNICERSKQKSDMVERWNSLERVHKDKLACWRNIRQNVAMRRVLTSYELYAIHLQFALFAFVNCSKQSHRVHRSNLLSFITMLLILVLPCNLLNIWKHKFEWKLCWHDKSTPNHAISQLYLTIYSMAVFQQTIGRSYFDPSIKLFLAILLIQRIYFKV